MAAPGPHLQLLARFAKDVLPLPPTSPDLHGDVAAAIQTIPIETAHPTPTLDSITVDMTTPLPNSASTTATSLGEGGGGGGGGGDGGGDGGGSGECSLLGNFAILVQLGLGALALLSLVYKRWRERPQRPLKIWFFDVSKQVFGSVLVHMANIFMSMLTSGRFSIKLDAAVASTAQRLLRRDDDEYLPNPCSFYLLNLAIDTTIGIPILIILLRVTTSLVAYTPLGKPPESIQSGNYGSPPNAWWWLKQSVIYFCGLFGMKVCVLIIFILLPWISRIGDWALRWTEGNEQLQIFFVMMFFPLIMNALQYYIIDSFIKQKTSQQDGSSSDHGSSGSEASYEHVPDNDSDESQGSELDEVDNDRRRRQEGHTDALKAREYDPDRDGDSPTVIGSSSSRRSQDRHPLPKELYPHE